MTEQKAPSGLPKWIFDHIELYKRDPEKAHLWDSSLGGSKGMLTTSAAHDQGSQVGQ